MEKKTLEKTKIKWANRALVTGIVSLFFGMCTLPVSGVPLGVPIGIFAIDFAVISKDEGYKGRAIAGIVTGSIGIAISLIIYALILFVITSLRDPEMIRRIPPEQLKYLQDFVQMYIVN